MPSKYTKKFFHIVYNLGSKIQTNLRHKLQCNKTINIPTTFSYNYIFFQHKIRLFHLEQRFSLWMYELKTFQFKGNKMLSCSSIFQHIFQETILVQFQLLIVSKNGTQFWFQLFNWEGAGSKSCFFFSFKLSQFQFLVPG